MQAACSELAKATLAGSGVQRSPTEARALYDKACRLDDYASCDTLGGLLIRGIKLPANPARGIELCAHACAHGIAPSCRRLADIYRAGDAVSCGKPKR